MRRLLRVKKEDLKSCWLFSRLVKKALNTYICPLEI